jgi:hypothetical protein
MPNRRSRYFQQRLIDLDYQWRFAPPEARLSIERSIRLIIAMEERILRAQALAEIAEHRLAHAEEIVRRLDQRD